MFNFVWASVASWRMFITYSSSVIFFGKIWYGVTSCLGFVMVHPDHLSDHLLQFETLGGFPKSICLALNLIRLSCVWVFWNERNTRVFQQKEASLQQLIDKIKLQSYR